MIGGDSMAKLHWKQRYANGGVCDFNRNYTFYFKWLLAKTCSCFNITGLPDTIDEFYIKSNLLTDGDIAITDIAGGLYAVIGAPGGQPDAYYRPTIYTVANPVLGSKTVTDGVDGIIIYNSPIDAYIPGGLYDLISQTATLLADNIVSINCTQINTRVQAMVTADGRAQREGAEIALKKLYAGNPYQVLEADLIEKINVNPINTAAAGQNISELIDLHNYIVSNYFQSIGIRSNNIRKKSHVLQDEIDVQNDYLQISILEILANWQAGFDKVNALYGTDIRVELNPALLDVIVSDEPDSNIGDVTDDITESTVDETDDNNADNTSNTDVADVTNVTGDNTDVDDTSDDVIDEIVDKQDTVDEIVDIINDVSDDTTTETGVNDNESNTDLDNPE